MQIEDSYLLHYYCSFSSISNVATNLEIAAKLASLMMLDLTSIKKGKITAIENAETTESCQYNSTL